MMMPWMIPLALSIGGVGTRTSFKARHTRKGSRNDWWLLLILAWTPALCWMISQFVEQY
jgi:uncharacterized membrane protein